MPTVRQSVAPWHWPQKWGQDFISNKNKFSRNLWAMDDPEPTHFRKVFNQDLTSPSNSRKCWGWDKNEEIDKCKEHPILKLSR